MNNQINTITLADQFRTVMHLRAALGRKFEEPDVNCESEKLIADAMAYCRMYRGDFAYMLSMQTQVVRAGRLSPKQAAGVLNCLVAECIYRAKHGEPGQPVPVAKPEYKPVSDPIDGVQLSCDRVVKQGTYTIVMADGSHVTLKLEWPEFGDFGPKTLMVSYMCGADNEHDFAGFAFVKDDNTIKVWSKFVGQDKLVREKAALLVLFSAADPIKYGEAYSLESGNCFRCGRKLTVPASLHRGLGPECAKKM